MTNKKFSLSKRIHSFKYAGRGIKNVVVEEHNARIHLVAAFVVVGLGLWLKVTILEWCLLSFAVGLVFICELLNSSLEQICNHLSTDHQEFIKKAKDYAAGAVLVAAIIAGLIGLLIFVPKLIRWINEIPSS